MDISGLLGFWKKSVISFSLPINGIASRKWSWKKLSKSSGVLRGVIMDSGRKRVQVNDLSFG
jgi:hypothetical protein